LVGVFAVWLSSTLLAQLVDSTKAPNAANGGINRALVIGAYPTEVGDGRLGSDPNTSLNVIRFDPFRAIRRGRQLFQRKFSRIEGQGPLTGDGFGDIENDLSVGAGLADSCAGCHGRPRGSAGFGGDVATRPDSRDAPHLFGLGLKEMLADEITTDLRSIRSRAISDARRFGFPQTRPLVSKGINYGTIRAFSNGSVDTSNVDGVNADLRVRPFFLHGETISIREFAIGAFKAEMGINAAGDPDLVAAQTSRVVTPSGMVLDGRVDTIERAPADEQGDIGTVNQRTAMIDFMEFYLLHYFKAGTGEQTFDVNAGRQTFRDIGCASCHIQDLRINRDRRVADVETVFNTANGNPFNRIFATATAQLANPESIGQAAVAKVPAFGSFLVRNIFTDFKRHDLGPNFHERNYDGTVRTEFLTTPLWGVGTTAPYGHDGRSINLTEVILRHGGEAQTARNRFAALSSSDRRRVIEFLNSLILFAPDDTASNLDPRNPAAPGYPQFGHGSIRLTGLFNDPSIVE
jgi:mono/diheme cytochrome c family protein